MKNKRIMVGCLILGVVLFVFILIFILSFGKKQESATTIGVIMPGSVDEEGWNGNHYQGIKKACDELGVRIELVENVKEYSGDCGRAIEEMAKNGIEMIILGSFNYPDEANENIRQHPEIQFYCCTSEYQDCSNYSSYFSRMYEGRFLAGILAGLKTETNEIGYVAAMSNSEVNRGINAFTLGVRSVNPEAEVVVMWTGSWDDKNKEIEEVETLVNHENVDVITYHQNRLNVLDTADKAGVYAIGYNVVPEGYSPRVLTSVVCDWSKVYKEFILDYLQQKEEIHSNYWIGIDKSAVSLTEYSQDVTEEEKEIVEAARQKIVDGTERIFSGVIRDNEGQIRCGENEIIRDSILLEQMDWLVEGVRIYE